MDLIFAPRAHSHPYPRHAQQFLTAQITSIEATLLAANNESSEVCGIIKPGQRVKLNRSQALNVNKLLTIRYLPAGHSYLIYTKEP